MTAARLDEVVARYREEIAEVDRDLVALVGRRLDLVRALHRYKGEQGIPVRDPERERWLVEHLQEANEGALSAQGVEELVRFVLELVREEQARG